MARLSYGPEVKKRSQQLLAVLLDYANDELDCDEVALDGLRSQIQVHWQTEQRLVVRTKVRFLEALTKIAAAPLNGEQIKEALRRLEDFLELLEDNRPNRGGSETWHFTLKLWHSRRDRDANLQRFETEWEQRRSQKSKQVTQNATQNIDVAVIDKKEGSPEIDKWWQWCRDVLEAQQYQRLTTNPLTVGDGVAFELDEVYVPLGLVERKQQERRETEVRPEQGSKLYEAEEGETAQLALEQFLEQLQQPGLAKRIAIAGEPGAGKTTLLQRIASWLLEQRALPIWISLADLQGATLEQYLLQDWLKAATRKVIVATELQEALGAQFNQGRVWLLLDAVDEMTEASSALSAIARQLRGWVADAHVILTCRLNVWDSGKNALETFTTYRNLTFSHGAAATVDQVGQFIQRWFQSQPALGDRLQVELDKLEWRRIKDVVKNPLRLALLCRAWSLRQGTLPNSKAALYQQFVETIYEWKQDRFPATLAQRWQLNQALGHLALQGLAQANTKFRLTQSFVQQVFRPSLELLDLALNLGWLNQVGISTTSGEKVYAFYHPTFQEYFAAQAIADWRCFLPATTPNSTVDLEVSPLVFASQWREVILLWLGRSDIPASEKIASLQTLTEWEDSCGGFYHYQAYFLAAAGLAEFPEYPDAESLLTQLLRWRFGEFNSEQQTWYCYPFPVQEGARVALLQTDRTQAIAALEQFIQSTSDFFAVWNAAYSLGKTFEPGNAIAIAAMTKLLQTLQSEPLRLQVGESLGKIDPGNSLAIATLIDLITTSHQDTLRRKAAYALGKLDPGNAIAAMTLGNLIASVSDQTLRLQAAENLLQLDPDNAIANTFIQANQKPARLPKTSRRGAKTKVQRDPAQAIASLEQRLAMSADASTQRRLACQLGHLQPGHPQAVEILLQLLQSPHATTLYRRIGEDLRAILLPEQLPMVVSTLKCFSFKDFSSSATVALKAPEPEKHSSQIQYQAQESYKLLWYCAQQLPYAAFHCAWQHPSSTQR